jgi:hypothetical protein
MHKIKKVNRLQTMGEKVQNGERQDETDIWRYSGNRAYTAGD